MGEERYALLPQLPVCLPAEELLALQTRVRNIHASPALLDYVQALLHFSRESPLYQGGLSPRAGLALLHAAKAWALMDGRAAVLPEDIQAVLPSVAGHRLKLASNGGGMAATVAPLLRDVAIP